jgi:hypothetical protein
MDVTKEERALAWLPDYHPLTPPRQAALFPEEQDCLARTPDEVLWAAAHGFDARHIYCSAAGKTAAELAALLGKCRIVVRDLESLRRVNEAAAGGLAPGQLEPIGVCVVPEGYPMASGQGIPARELPDFARQVRAMSRLSVRGCFVEGDAAGLHGADLGRYFRACYETAKLLSVTLPCTVGYLCCGNCLEAVFQNSIRHPETLEDALRSAQIVAAQNASAFYSRLLIT